MPERREARLLAKLTVVCEAIARGRYEKAKQLFELTKPGEYPASVAVLAEAFGLMLVKVEAREYHLEQVVDDLRRAQKELAEAKERLAWENVTLKQHLRSRFAPAGILGDSPGMRVLLQRIEKVAPVSANVLITGETGTGKELVAKALHYGSPRAEKPFVALNCAALPEALIESELFGIEKGVATGVERRIGRIEQAQGGTLFLDEIGEMPAAGQAKLLRALEGGAVERVGGRVPIPVAVRVIAATNKDLKRAAECGEFRADLFYRLNGVHLRLLPLRERREDIPLLANHFVRDAARRLGRPDLVLSPEALALLGAYAWPGNVRELQHEIERAAILAAGARIAPEDFSEALQEAPPGGGPQRAAADEPEDIRRALAESHGNKAGAARRLGLSREGLRKKMKRHGMA